MYVCTPSITDKSPDVLENIFLYEFSDLEQLSLRYL